MIRKKTKRKTVKKVKEATDVRVLEGEIVESKEVEEDSEQDAGEAQQAQGAQSLTKDIANTSVAGEFQPTNKMLRWLNFEVQNPNFNNKEIAQRVNIAEQTLYRWRENPAFLRWYKQEWDKRLILHAPKLDQIGLKNADQYKFWQAMQQRVGNLEQQTLKAQTNIQMNVNFMEEDTQPSE